jgi:RimJ/RimL family protein N-acetyltransferase
MTIEIKKLAQEDWEDFKSIRLESLQKEPDVFLSSFDAEKNLSDDNWKDQLTGDDFAIFGIYEDQKIIGVTSVFTWKGDESGQTAILAMSYLNKKYRGQGLAQVMYNARIEWAVKQLQLKKIRVSHREGNEPSRRANQNFGFQYIGKELIIWPDGTEDWEHNYEINLEVLRQQPKPKPGDIKP